MAPAPWLSTPVRTLALVAALAAGALAPGATGRADPGSGDVDGQLQQQSQQFEQIVEQYNAVTEQKARTQGQITALDKQIKPLATEVTTLQTAANKLAVQAYKGGRLGMLGAVLDSGSPNNLLDNVSTLDRVSLGQRHQLSAFTAAKSKLDGQRSKLTALYNTQAKQESELGAKKKTIEADISRLKQLRSAAGRSSDRSGSDYNGPIPVVSGRAGAVVAYAYHAIGKPYAWAQSGPGSYDCSGLTLAAWSQAGVHLPHNAAMQYNQVAHIPRSAIAPGDLVFYENLGHVALYVGGNQVIHAPDFGEVVKLSSIDMMAVYGIGRP